MWALMFICRLQSNTGGEALTLRHFLVGPVCSFGAGEAHHLAPLGGQLSHHIPLQPP